MTHADLTQIETACGVSLSDAYREWALKLPPAGSEVLHWHHLFDDPESIVDDNLSLRRGDHGDPFRSFLFSIGGSDGNFVFINLNDSVAKDSGGFDIYYFDHEDDPCITFSNWKPSCLKNPCRFGIEQT